MRSSWFRPRRTHCIGEIDFKHIVKDKNSKETILLQKKELYDVIIIGGGPAGATAAMYCVRHNLKVLLLEKYCFPRDKVCGDAISGKSVSILNELGLEQSLQQSPQIRANGVTFSSPNGKIVKIPFTPSKATKEFYGYVCKRIVFDNMLFSAAQKAVTTCIENFKVQDLIKDGEQVIGVKGQEGSSNKEQEFFGKVIVGADGFDSIIARKTGLYKHDSRHWVVATRSYYHGITDLDDYIEIHFVKDVLPGYFWIFPLENGMANVGIGMLHSEISKRGINLRQAHLEAVESPYFKDRFKNAELKSTIRGWNLPLGSKKREIHGNGFVLLGDAAGLIDPFSGEGIGNAMFSAKLAAEVISKARSENNFSAETLGEYPTLLWQSLGAELETSYLLQRIGKFRPLLNLVVGKASKSTEISQWISSMMANETSKGELVSPLTYLRLLFT